jgi:hypothetical protein
MAELPKKIQLASQSRLAEVEALAPRFFREVLEYEYDDVLVTDKSDLRDFADVFGDRNSAVDSMLDRLESHYLIDARQLGNTRIVELLEFLQARGVAG